MLFRCSLVLRDIWLRPEQILTFEQTTPESIVLLIRRPSEENAVNQNESDTICEIQSVEEVSAKVVQQFIQETKTPSQIPPQAVTEVATRVGRRMTNYASRVARLIRWRTGNETHPSPIRCQHKPTEWSVDGNSWEFVPRSFTGVLRAVPRLSPNDAIVLSVKMLLENGHDEPLAHDLYLEARKNFSGDPRSSLLLAIAAAEIGLKSFIATLVPDAAWLAFHSPTPPIVAILTEYLPELPLKNRLNPSLIISEEMISTLRKGVLLRNQLSHAGKQIVSDMTLGEILDTVHDLLFLLDYYAGHDWAINYVNRHTVTVLTGSKAGSNRPESPKIKREKS